MELRPEGQEVRDIQDAQDEISFTDPFDQELPGPSEQQRLDPDDAIMDKLPDVADDAETIDDRQAVRVLE